MRRSILTLLAILGAVVGGSPDAGAQGSSDDSSSLLSVSCPTSSFCMAVGSASTGPASHFGLAYRSDGTSWHAVAIAPTAAGKSVGGLDSVSCSSASFCLAIGFASDGRTRASVIAERWNGRSWRVIPVERPGRTSEVHVACVGASRCVAVGSHQLVRGGKYYYQAVAWQYVGGALRLRDTASRPFPHTGLSSVSCFSADNCTAVGGERAAGRPLVEHWNGARWSWGGPVPQPARAAKVPGVTLFGVSCPAPRSCVAVGVDRKGSKPAVESRKSGGAWTFETASLDNLDFDSGYFATVSCMPYQRCAAVGQLFDKYDYAGIIAWRDFRTNQFVVKRTSAEFADVSCRDNGCVYVGYEPDSNGIRHAAIYQGRANPTEQQLP